MNFKLVLRITGFTLLIEAAAMLLPMGVALLYGENPIPFLSSILIILAAACVPVFLLKPKKDFFAREGFFTVGLIWVLFGVFGALPFWFSGQFGPYVDCFFETISGFTTTGATILTAIEGLPMGLLFWRSFTHWLGGMGVLVLTAALLPFLGISSNHLIRAESPGPVKSKLMPRASQSSKILYAIYLDLTAVEAVLQKADARLDVLGQRYMAGEITLVEAQEAIGEDYGAYMAFLVGCLPELRRCYAAAGLPEELFWHTMMDLKYKLMECHTVKGLWGNFAFWWYDRFYKMTRFTLGRLQFETVTYEWPAYTCGGITVQPGDPVVNIHIPSAGPLTEELRREAYQKAYEFFPACRKKDALPLVCHSWLLDPEYRTFLPASSNLIGFQKDFEIIACEKQEEFKDAWRVFGADGGKRPQELPRDTSMRRGFADFLSAGGRTGIGSGIMLWGPEGRITDEKEEL